MNAGVAQIAMEAFALAASGTSVRRILAALTPKRIVSRNRTPMHASSLGALLTNLFYYGLVQVEGKLVEGRHEALVVKQEFEKVERLLAKGRRNA